MTQRDISYLCSVYDYFRNRRLDLPIPKDFGLSIHDADTLYKMVYAECHKHEGNVMRPMSSELGPGEQREL